MPAFVAGTGVTNLTLTVATGASITGTQNTGGTTPNFQFSNVQVNDNSTIVNNGTISNVGASVRDNVAVNLAGTTTTLINNGTISSSYTTAGTATNHRLYGVNVSAPDGATYSGVQITNNGAISISQSSASVARGIYAGENLDSMTFDNFGTVSVTKIGNAATTAVVAGVDADDDTDTLVVNNHAGARITATGGNTYAVGGRAQDYTIQNDGTITALTSSGSKAAILVYGGSDDGSGTLAVDNSVTGIINGNVSITDTSPFGATLPTATNGTRDSNVTNEGTINGSFIYGAGTHTLDNSGTISGSITVNQNIGAGVIGVGGASFTLTNEGALGGATGNITINDRADSVNVITLTGTGFNATGNITTTGNGSNSLTLDGVTNLGSVQNFSSVDLTTSRVTVTNGVSLTGGATLATTIYGPGGTVGNPSLNAGNINGTLTVAGATTLVPTFATIVHNDDTYQIASAVAGPGPITAADGTALVSSTASTNTGTLLLTTSVRDARSVAGITPAGGATLNGLLAYNGTNAQLQNLGTLVQGLGSDAAVARAGRALSPVVNGADIQAPIAVSMLFHQQVDTRLDAFMYAQLPLSGRSADLGVPRPVPVYGVLPTNGAWIEGIGGGISQSSLAGVEGYNATITGVLGGYDRLIAPGLRVGGAFGYAETHINDAVNLGTRAGIQTYQGLAYAEYLAPGYYVRGSAGYGGLDYQQTRQIGFDGFSDTAFGSHKGGIFTARAEGGVPFEYNGSLLIPYAAFTYNHLKQDGYTENAGNGAGLTVQSASNDSDRLAVGGKVLIPLGNAPVFSYLFPFGSSVALEARAAYMREFGNVAQTVTASFVGAGNVFVAGGPTPERDMIDYGAGIRFGSGAVQFEASYNGVARSTYLEQIGLIRARYVF